MQLTMRLQQRLVQQQAMKLPSGPINWRSTAAFDMEGADLLFARGRWLPKGMPLAQRLAAVDKANAPFRFAYEEDHGDYYRIPLLRNRNIRPEDIREEISEKEYTQAVLTLEAAGKLQRIIRAVPYTQIRHTLLNHLAQEGAPACSVRLIGIDRGGRIPTLLARKALGLSQAHFLKVDQGGAGLDIHRLEQMAAQQLFYGSYLLFIDSTVDSGRQITALERYFDGDAARAKFGHLGWIVAGSNENGQTLERHLQVDWGVDPDETFEDDPRLMGVDYLSERILTQVRAVPSHAASKIRSAFLSIPRGHILDLTGQDMQRLVKARAVADEVNALVEEDEGPWAAAKALYKAQGGPALAVDGAQLPPIPETIAPTQRVAIIGSRYANGLSDDGVRLIGRALAADYEFLFGIARGLPGKVMQSLVDEIPQAQFTYFEPRPAEGKVPKRVQVHGRPIRFTGGTKEWKRFNMMMGADAVLVLPGSENTLMETLFAVAAGKRVVAIRGYGPIAIFLEKVRKYRRRKNVILTDNLYDALLAITHGPAEEA